MSFPSTPPFQPTTFFGSSDPFSPPPSRAVTPGANIGAATNFFNQVEQLPTPNFPIPEETFDLRSRVTTPGGSLTHSSNDLREENFSASPSPHTNAFTQEMITEAWGRSQPPSPEESENS